MGPALTGAQICHVHHGDADAEIHGGNALKLFVPLCHFLGSLLQPTLQVFGFDRAGNHLQNIFLVRHTGNVFFRCILGIRIDILSAHPLCAAVHAAVLRLGDSADHRQLIHLVHFLSQPL